MEYTPSFRDQLQNGSEPSWRDALSDELYHHGIKGMHWGVRRPRNEDGIIQGAGASLAKKQKSLRAKARENNDSGRFSRKMAANIQRDADAHGAKARATKNIIKKAGHRIAQAWDANAAETQRGIARSFEKKAAKQTLKADRLKANEEFTKFNREARRKAEKNIDYENSGKYDRELDAAIDKRQRAYKAAKSRYKQTVNADKIERLKKRRNVYGGLEGANRVARKARSKQKSALGKAILTVATPGLAVNEKYYGHRRKVLDRKINRLSN